MINHPFGRTSIYGNPYMVMSLRIIKPRSTFFHQQHLRPPNRVVLVLGCMLTLSIAVPCVDSVKLYYVIVCYSPELIKHRVSQPLPISLESASVRRHSRSSLAWTDGGFHVVMGIPQSLDGLFHGNPMNMAGWLRVPWLDGNLQITKGTWKLKTV